MSQVGASSVGLMNHVVPVSVCQMMRSTRPLPSVSARRLGLLIVLSSFLAGCNQTEVSASPASPASPSPAVLSAVSTISLGTVTPVANVPADCPKGSVCAGLSVACPGVREPAIAFTATRPASGTPRGMVVLFSGNTGVTWWADEVNSIQFLDRLQARGFVTVQVRWSAGWLIAAAGEDAGTGRLACRPASLIRWLHDKRYVPLGIPAGPVGRCGFCITGNSAGASQVSYALSFYGLDVILDGVFPTSGPPHAAQDKGCLRRPGESRYQYGGKAILIDQAHGYLRGGPCTHADPGFLSRWLAQSVDTGGRDFMHPKTRVHFIHSDHDVPAVPHALDYIRKLRSAGTPYLKEQVIPGMPHRIEESAAGLDALFRAILGMTTT